MAGTAVPDESNGGMSRRVVLAPGNADCDVPFPAATTNYRGQEAGVPYDQNVIVMVMAMFARTCFWGDYSGEFGPNGKMGVDLAAFIWMWSDENPVSVGEGDTLMSVFANDRGNAVSYPTAAIARGAGPIGGLTMATELFNGHRVDLLWPGTGPMTDASERGALKDFMRNMDTAHEKFNVHSPYVGFAGSIMMPEEFIADDLMDPCSNNGQGKRLYAVTCIGGHVVSLYIILMAPKISAFPASISGLTHLRHIYFPLPGSPSGELKFVIPCELGQLASLVAFVLPGSGTVVEFPEDDSCMSGLVSLEEVMIGAFKMNRFPASFLQLPQMQTVSLTRAPVASLPATLPPKLRVLKLSEVGASGPLPSFNDSALLEEVRLDRNNLTLGDAGAFDYCPNLRILDVSHNSISTTLFRFAGSTKIETIDISHNAIHGAAPSQWAELKSCTEMRASHNNIVGPSNPMVSMTKLAIQDLSHNRLETDKENVLKGFKPYLLKSVPAATIRILDLSHNLFAEGPMARTKNEFFGSEVLLGQDSPKYPQLVSMDISHNFIWGPLNLYQLHYNLDASYNNITVVVLKDSNDCCSGAAYQKPMYKVDWRHQMSDMAFIPSTKATNLTIRHTIDQALNTSLDFKTIEFLPRHDSFEQIEHPTKSGRFPFVCPTWSVYIVLYNLDMPKTPKTMIHVSLANASYARAGKEGQNPR
jgi:Leucine-rich repeat (LRR) protein